MIPIVDQKTTHEIRQITWEEKYFKDIPQTSDYKAHIYKVT